MSSIPELPLAERANWWWTQLEKIAADERAAAMELYGGQHWSVVRELPAVAAEVGLSVSIWVASAGYGLIGAGSRIGSYSATFSTRSTDCVVSESDRTSDWWNDLTRKRSPSLAGPRAVAALAHDNPRATIVVVASPSYVRAMRDDLLAAREELRNPDSLIIFSSGVSRADELTANTVESDAVLLGNLGGARVSLHARVAKKALVEWREHPLSASGLRARFKRIVAATPSPSPLNRTPMSDVEVARFIRRALRDDPKTSHTRALRHLRSSGLACEHKRFKQLFNQTRGHDATQ